MSDEIEREIIKAANRPSFLVLDPVLNAAAEILVTDYDYNRYPRQTRVYSPPAYLGEGTLIDWSNR